MKNLGNVSWAEEGCEGRSCILPGACAGASSAQPTGEVGEQELI